VEAGEATGRSYAKPHRPRPIAVVNALGRALERIGVRASLREESLIRAARKGTGLHHLGDQDWREPLLRTLDAVEREARLHPIGRFGVRTVLIRSVSQRLRIEALRDLHPEIFQLPIEAPVFIVGLQRTGTTILQRLLARHPALRALTSWESANPAPFLERGPLAPGQEDPRIGVARIAERSIRYMAPDFFASHPVLAEGEEEDSLMFDPSFRTTTSEAVANIPSFTAWLEQSDPEILYRRYREVMQVLLWQRPGRWLGKTPFHLEYLDTLLETFPDARIIHTHRDPVETVASLCSMLSHARGFMSDHVDPVEVGRQWLRKTAYMVERSLAARAAADESRFIDVYYRDTVEDPWKQVHRACEWIDAPIDDATEADMRRFLAENKQHKYGRHRYQLSDFGLSEDQVREVFAAYRSRYGFG
jgi:hypothetical protein